MHMRAVVATGAMLMVAAMLMLALAGILMAMLAPLRGVRQSGDGVLMMNLTVLGDAHIGLRLAGKERQQEEETEDAARNHPSNMAKLWDSDNRPTMAVPLHSARHPCETVSLILAPVTGNQNRQERVCGAGSSDWAFWRWERWRSY